MLRRLRRLRYELAPRIRYPKLTVLAASFILAYGLFSDGTSPVLHAFDRLGLLGVFLAGMLYACGFTSAPSAAILLLLGKHMDIVVAGIVAGLGALLSDLAIFAFIRHSLRDEISMVSKAKLIIRIRRYARGARQYMLLPLAGFIIASPLPTELGIALVASVRGISIARFAAVAYLFHTAGIFAILLVGSML